MPGGSAAAISSAASAPRNSRCRPPSICCDRCARLPDDAETVALAATDPGNPYGTLLPWPADPERADAGAAFAGGFGAAGRRTTRSVGSLVILVNGALGAYISRGARQLQVFLPDDEPARSTVARAVAARLAELARAAGLLIAEVNGIPTVEHAIAPYLVGAGFAPSAMGFMMRRAPAAIPSFNLDLDEE